MDASLPAAYGFALVLFRTSGLCMTAPLLSMRSVPGRVRIALAGALALVTFSGAGFPSAVVPASFLGLAAGAAGETVIGLVAGLVSRYALDAALAAGQLAGLSMGFGYGALLDPMNGTESTVVGQLFQMMALGAAVAAGIHREAITWLAISLTMTPPGSAASLVELAHHAVVQAIFATTLAVRLAFPLLAAITFGHATLGIMGRTAPQIQISSVGFSVAILAGGGAIYLLTPSIAHIAAQAAVEAFSKGR
jgi:flagellar biosynthetic protein FliR